MQLQGSADEYSTWEEVEKFLLPDTPLTAGNGSTGVDALSKMLGQGLGLDVDAADSASLQPAQMSPSASPASTTSSLSTSVMNQSAKDECSAALTEHGIIPQARPLLNYTVWRNHHEDASFATPGKFILVTNDPIVQKQASKFGVRAKLLSQIQSILGKSVVPATGFDGSNSPEASHDTSLTMQDMSDDEEEVTFDPSQRPSSSRGPKPNSNVLDPDHFGRSPKSGPRITTSAKRGNPEQPRRPNNATRGRGHNSRANGFVANGFGGGRGYNGPVAPRGNGAPRVRGGMPPGRAAKPSYPRQIDPDSYARPAPAGRRGRGGYSKLWEPTSSG